ncbi:MAG: alpha/beta hydrolase [Clostridia bacterium]|nr:alpha/beta hydrolase [Clostridia bacterium]
MRSEVVFPRKDRPYVTLTTYLLEKKDSLRPAVIVFPGGAYSHYSWREAEPVARQFLGDGFDAFILRYSLNGDAAFPSGALADAAFAIRYVRDHAEEFGIDPHKILVLGFSAGAHLAGYLSCCYDLPELTDNGSLPEGYLRPDGMILAYGVLDGFENTHADSLERAAGGKLNDELREKYSVIAHVTKDTPPAFLWHASNDGSVPPQNSFLMAEKLQGFGIPYELHLYPLGGHGSATASEEVAGGNESAIFPDTERWVQDALDWSRRLFSENGKETGK